MDLQTAEKHIFNGYVAGFISAIITFLIILLSASGNDLGYHLDWWSLLDVFLMVGLSLGIREKSRVCAVLMLVYFLFSKGFMIVETGKLSGMGAGTFIWIYYFAQAIRGTFAYQDFYADAENEKEDDLPIIY
jgi:serine/threonine-protein kinase